VHLSPYFISSTQKPNQSHYTLTFTQFINNSSAHERLHWFKQMVNLNKWIRLVMWLSEKQDYRLKGVNYDT